MGRLGQSREKSRGRIGKSEAHGLDPRRNLLASPSKGSWAGDACSCSSCWALRIGSLDRAGPDAFPDQLNRAAHWHRDDDLYGVRKQRAVDRDVLFEFFRSQRNRRSRLIPVAYM